jgi:hypothetical protein
MITNLFITNNSIINADEEEASMAINDLLASHPRAHHLESTCQ